jgi:integration host factor subunit beta
MTKSELIEAIFKRYPNLSVKDLKKVVEIIFSKISDALINKNRVEIRGFGSFSLRERRGHSTVDPRSEKIISVGKRNVIYFRAGQSFNDMLNPSNDI